MRRCNGSICYSLSNSYDQLKIMHYLPIGKDGGGKRNEHHKEAIYKCALHISKSVYQQPWELKQVTNQDSSYGHFVRPMPW